jgi:hypothetical protein
MDASLISLEATIFYHGSHGTINAYCCQTDNMAQLYFDKGGEIVTVATESSLQQTVENAIRELKAGQNVLKVEITKSTPLAGSLYGELQKGIICAATHKHHFEESMSKLRSATEKIR